MLKKCNSLDIDTPAALMGIVIPIIELKIFAWMSARSPDFQGDFSGPVGAVRDVESIIDKYVSQLAQRSSELLDLFFASFDLENFCNF